MIVQNHLALAFLTGLASGATVSFFRLKAKLELYRKFVQKRLSASNLTVGGSLDRHQQTRLRTIGESSDERDIGFRQLFLDGFPRGNG